MKKYILALITTFTFSYAGLVDAIAIIINDIPITLYDIDQKMLTNKLTKQQAVESLIDETLYAQELRMKNVDVDIFDVDNYIDKLAAQNKMSSLDFKSLVRQQQNYELFKLKIEKQIRHQKLIKRIASGKLKIADEADMKIFYEQNKNQYKIADTIEVTAYVSKNKNLLDQLKLNPMMQNKAIATQKITFKQNELNAQTKYILNSTKQRAFSAIFAQNKNYNMFYISKKKDITNIPFAQVKESIFQQIMKTREQKYLKEYFETLKITADIRVLR